MNLILVRSKAESALSPEIPSIINQRKEKHLPILVPFFGIGFGIEIQRVLHLLFSQASSAEINSKPISFTFPEF